MKIYEKLNTLIQGLTLGLNGMDEIMILFVKPEVILGMYTQAKKLLYTHNFDSDYYKDLTQKYLQYILENKISKNVVFESNEHMYNGIKHIMKGILINDYKKNKTRFKREEEYTNFVNSLTRVEENEKILNYRKTLQKVIEILPKKEKQAARLRYIENIQEKEVALEMDVSESAAKALVNRARRKIIMFLKVEAGKK